MPLYLVRFVDPLVFDRVLSDQEESDVRAALATIRDFLNRHGPYATLLMNYKDLSGFLERSSADFVRSTKFQTAHDIDVLMLEANRLTMNFLASARAYIDITSRTLEHESEVERQRFNVWCSVQYDGVFSFRLFEALRNVAQHQDFPTRAYSSSRGQSAKGLPTEVRQDIMVDRATLLGSSRTKAKFRSELGDLTGNCSLAEHAKIYFDCLGVVNLQVVRNYIAKYTPSADLIERVVRELGDPKTVPIYFMEKTHREGGELVLGLLDPHLHGTHLIRSLSAASVATNFGDLDRSAQSSQNWPS